MKKINAIINSFAFLLLAVLMSACNKDGIETIVIEDGQPSVAQMLIGRWNPTGGEMANPSTGEVTEDINISDVPWLDFGENGIGSWGNGGSGTGGSAGESFDWNADEGSGPIIGGGSGYDGEGPSVTLGGERWYIFQLTERILIIYRFYGDYIIIYYYYRVGDYNEPEPEPTPEPGNDCPYQPQFSDNQLIVRIEKHNNTPYYQSDEVYLYGYDTHGRIASYAYGENENNIYWIWTYRYDAEKVTAMLDDRMVFEGYLNKDGYITEMRTDGEAITWYDYDDEGHLTGGKTMNDYIGVEYDTNWNMVYAHYPYWATDWTYTYTNDDVNSNSVDLNKVCTFSGFNLDATGTDMNGAFAQFDFLGRRSPCLVETEENDMVTTSNNMYKFDYEMVNGRVDQIIRYQGNNICTYKIYYAN